MANDPDPSELARSVARVEAVVQAGAAETRRAIDALAARIEEHYVTHESFRGYRNLTDERFRAILEKVGGEGLAGRVKAIEDRHVWLTRTVLTALVLPVIVGVVIAVLLSGGPS